MNIQSSQVTSSLTRKERFLKALHFQPVDRPPVWMMRQAGRYLPEYQAVKQEYTFQEMCRTPSVAADVSIQPLDILDIDAIITFNDILIPFDDMGFKVQYGDGGPSIEPRIRNEEEIRKVPRAKFDQTPPVYNTIQDIRKRVGEEVPILGFAGAPFTMATYLIEGHMSKTLRNIKEAVFGKTDALKALLDTITETVIDYLKVQIDAGADAVQIFDTWAGTLPRPEYCELAMPYQKQIVDAIQSQEIPVILYVKGSSPFLHEMKQTGAKVLSVDWITPLWEVEKMVGEDTVLQGNLDPTLLYASPEVVEEHVRTLLRNFDRPSGHIFNLGHGILPGTPVDSAKAVVKAIQEL